MLTMPATSNNSLASATRFIDLHQDEDGNLSPTDHDLLINAIRMGNLSLVIFHMEEFGWCVAMDECAGPADSYCLSSDHEFYRDAFDWVKNNIKINPKVRMAPIKK